MAVLATEKILTLDYWKPASHLKIGDYVFDRNGKIARVKMVQQFRSEECYEVTLNDYLSIRGDQNLGFAMETSKYRIRACEYKQTRKFKRPLKPFVIADLLDQPLKNKRNRLLYSIPTTAPIQLPYQDLPVPPFVFGFWLFNEKRDGKMAIPKGVPDTVIEKFKDHGYKIRGKREFDVYPSIRSQLSPNVPSKIPENYLLAAPEQRWELLKGIIHAKPRQYSKSRDTFRFTSGHFGTVQQMQYLVESLGHKTKVEYNESKEQYTLLFRSRTQLIEGQKSPPLKVHQSRRYVMEITQIPAQMCVHIETTGLDNTILVGEGFIACR